MNGNRETGCSSKEIRPYFHYYRDPLSGTWTDSMLPTDRVVGSRPSIGFDSDNNVYAAYLTRANGNDILRVASAEKLAAGGYAPWEVIWEDFRDWLGTPLLDQERLLNDNILSIFLQENTTSDFLTGTDLHVLEYRIDDLEVPGELTVTIADASVSEADGVGATTATVSRNTDTTDPLTVTLLSDDTTEAMVLGTITIPAGQTTSAPFNIDAIDDLIVDGTQTVTITASATGHADGTDTLDVTDDNVASLTVTIAASSVSEADGAGATTATVSRNTDTTNPLTVTLVSDDTTEATVLGTITIPAGQSTSAPFNIDAIDDLIVDGTQTVTVTASATGHADGTDTLDVTDDTNQAPVLAAIGNQSVAEDSELTFTASATDPRHTGQ